MIIFLVSFLHFLNISLLLTRHLAWRKKLNKFIAFMPCTEWAKANKCEAFKCKNVRKHIMLCIVVYWQKVQRGDEPGWTYNNDNSNNINMEQKLKAYTHTQSSTRKRDRFCFFRVINFYCWQSIFCVCSFRACRFWIRLYCWFCVRLFISRKYR